MKDLPTKIETPEEYIQVCEQFALPMMFKQAKKIVDAIEEMHNEIKNNESIDQERIDLYANRIKGYASFASDDSPIFPLFQQIAKLEEQFDEQGLFDDEDSD